MDNILTALLLLLFGSDIQYKSKSFQIVYMLTLLLFILNLLLEYLLYI